jgi:hypothetical protein
MLAVVQHEQQTALAEGGSERIDDGLACGFTNTDGGGDAMGDQLRVGQRSQLDQPDAVGIAVGHLGCQLERQAGLAAATNASEGKQPCLGQSPLDLSKLYLAPDETGDRYRQVVHRRFGRRS